MSWPCRLVEDRDDGWEIGDMYYSKDFSQDHTSEFLRVLSPEYKRDWYGKRPPIFVMTPAGPWCIDAVSTDGHGNNNNQGWTVTGDVPNITASPSINFEGCYHGWLQNGVLSDDVEGKMFLPQAIKATEQPSEAVAEDKVYGNDCKDDSCS